MWVQAHIISVYAPRQRLHDTSTEKGVANTNGETQVHSDLLHIGLRARHLFEFDHSQVPARETLEAAVPAAFEDMDDDYRWAPLKFHKPRIASLDVPTLDLAALQHASDYLSSLSWGSPKPGHPGITILEIALDYLFWCTGMQLDQSFPVNMNKFCVALFHWVQQPRFFQCNLLPLKLTFSPQRFLSRFILPTCRAANTHCKLHHTDAVQVSLIRCSVTFHPSVKTIKLLQWDTPLY